MRRRTLWQAGAAALFPAVGSRGGPLAPFAPSAPSAPLAPTASSVPSPLLNGSSRLVWHAAAAALLDDEGLAHALPGVPATPPAVVPELAPPVVWHATADGRLQRWRWSHAPRPGWQRLVDTQLPAPAHALAAAADGEVLAAHGEQLTLLDARGHLLRRYDGQDLAHTRQGRAASLHALPHRRSLLAAWPALREWWEISLDPAAPPVFDGYVHDHRMAEAIASPGHLGVRRIPFDGPAPVPGFAPAGWPWAAAMDGEAVTVVHLDVRRTVARWPAPAAQVAASVMHVGLWWLPVAGDLWAVDPRRWTVLQRRATPWAGEGVHTLVSAQGHLHALVGGTVWQDAGGDWQPVAQGVAALGVAPRADALLTAPPPWSGVAGLDASPATR